MQPVSPSRARKRLVIKLGALGDVALSLPLLQGLAEHGSAALTVVTTPPFVCLFESVGVGRVMVLPDRGTLAVIRLGLELRRENFDQVIDLQGRRASRLLSWLAGPATERVGLASHWPNHKGADLPGTHPELRFKELARVLELPAPLTTPVPVAAERVERVRTWLRAQGLEGRPLVLMHAGCSPLWPTKRWPVKHFEQTAVELGAAGYQVLWLGARDEQELNAALARSVGVNATGAFQLPDLLALAQEARFAITNDSGPMHLLAIGGLPVYGLFGPIDAGRSHAWGQRARALDRTLPCRPCYSKKCLLPGSTHDCLAGLLPAHVLQRLQSDGWLPALRGEPSNLSAP